MINPLIEFAGRQWRASLFVLLFVLISGAGASYLIPKETNPDISFGAAYISLRAEGATGENVVDTVIKPLEEELDGLTVIDTMTATAYDDGGNIVVTCFTYVDPDQCSQEVRNAVNDGEQNIAGDADAPSVTPINISDEFPTIVVSLFGDASPTELKLAATFLQEKIEAIGGVEEAEMSGELTEQTEIIVSPTVFEDYGLSPLQVVQQVSNANTSVGAPASQGAIGQTTVVIDSGLDTLADIYNITLKAADDAEIRLGDVAEIRPAFAEPDTLAQVNGKPAVTLVVKRKAGSNVRAIAQETRELVSAIITSTEWNDAINVTFTQDSSILVNQLLGDLINAVAMSILLVLIVIVAVLGLRTGLLVGIAIPGSMMIGILFLFAYGATMNIVVMFSLILASGMLVDGAIVVTEYADRSIAKGMARQDAYIAAAKRMSLPIISSTATTLVVFAPLLFWPGTVGSFMGFLPLTLIVTLAGSLIMAMIFVPVLGEHLEKFLWVIFSLIAVGAFFGFAFTIPGQIAETMRPVGFNAAGEPLDLPGYARLLGGLAGVIIGLVMAGLILALGRLTTWVVAMTARDRFIGDTPDEEEQELEDFSGFTGAYVGFLSRAIRVPWASTGAIFLSVIIIYIGGNAGAGFFPEVDPEQFIINVKERGNLSIEEKEARAEQVQQIVFDMQSEYSEFANFRMNASGTNPGEDTIATIDIELADWSVRLAGSGRSIEALEADLRERISSLFTAQVQLTLPAAGPPTGKDVQVELLSENNEQLLAAARTISIQMREMGLIDIEDQLNLPGFEAHIEANEARIAEQGISKRDISNYVALATAGLDAGSWLPAGYDDEIDIKIRYDENFRDLESALAINVITNQGAVPLRDLAALKYEPKAGIITRIDGDRVLTPQANIPPGSSRLVSDYVEELKVWLESGAADLGSSVTWQFKGADEEQAESFAFLGQAFMIALFVMFIILVTQFNSFYHAILILLAVGMSVSGVVLGLTITGGAFDLMTNIGIISLAGIVVNNNIVLIDTYQQLMREMRPTTYEDRLRVVMLTGAQRLRPVMLTTVTTILGLLPMAMGVNIDFTTGIMTIGSPATQWWQGLAQSVVFGLSFATVLTLVFTPAALALPALLDRQRETRREQRGVKTPMMAAE